MKITVELPDDVAGRPDSGRTALEALALEGYRTGALSHYEASQLLQLSRFEFEALLKSRNIYEHAYGIEDLQQDIDTLAPRLVGEVVADGDDDPIVTSSVSLPSAGRRPGRRGGGGTRSAR